MSKRQRKARRRSQAQRRAAIGTAVVSAAFAAPAVANAADISVTSANDTGAGTLRQAITDSQNVSHPGADRILVASLLSGDTVHLATALPHVTQSLEIDGPSGANLKLDASALSDSALYVDHAGAVTIANLTVRDGTAGAGGAVYSRYTTNLAIRHSTFSGNTGTNVGGALSSYKDTLTVSDSHFSDNTASGQDGGAIRSADSDVVINGSTFGGNTANRDGGGVADTSGGSVSISGSTFDSNSALHGGAVSVKIAPLTLSGSTVTGNTAAAAGGIYTYLSAPLAIQGSTVVGNHATGGSGGGGFFYKSPGSVSGSTFLANSASAGGGGFRAGATADPLTVTNSTITGNHSSSTGGGVLADAGYATTTPVALESSTVAGNSAVNGGGGMFEFDTAFTPGPGVTLHNTIVGENTSTALGSQPDLQRGTNVGPFAAAFTLVQHAPPSGDLTETSPGSNVLGQDPKLAAPADNGGPTQTQALQAGSPAIDAGSTGLFCDQRGFTRPVGRAPDIGAFEFGSSASANCAAAPPGGGTPTTTGPGQGGQNPPTIGVLSLVGRVRATHKGVRFTVACGTAPCAGLGRLTVREQLRGTKVIGLRKIKTRTAAVGKRRFALAAGQRRTITINLTAAGRKLLRQFKREPVKLVVMQGAATVKTARVVIKK